MPSKSEPPNLISAHQRGRRLLPHAERVIDEIHVSAGTAAVLGFLDVKMDVAPTTAYLMLGGRCAMNCEFCSQARSSHASALSLSRVTWPPYALNEVIERICTAYQRRVLHRACLQATVTRRAEPAALQVVQHLRSTCDVPLDVSILPQSMDTVRQLIDAGVDHIGFGLDAASHRIFDRVKSGSWDRSIDMIRQTAGRYPGRAAVHLIVGLGETEQEMVETIQMMHDWSITIGLFAFTPLRGTPMESFPPPSLGQYRRMQAARHLIAHNVARVTDFRFDDSGRLVGIEITRWEKLLTDGNAFETSGCPDCNRPYYNERPGGVMYNYPRPLTLSEAHSALAELELEQVVDP